MAVLCLAAGDKKCSSTVNMLTDILKADSSTNSVYINLVYLLFNLLGRSIYKLLLVIKLALSR